MRGARTHTSSSSSARSSWSTCKRALSLALAAASLAALPSALADASAGNFEIVQPNSMASAMMMALVNEDAVFILDKVENNPDKLDNGKPVWGSILSLTDNSVEGIDVNTNTFCASGGVLGNGTWLVAGGNQAVGAGGAAQAQNLSPYQDYDGRLALRLMEPNNNTKDLAWIDSPATGGTTLQMQSMRWYPGAEVLADGSMVLVGGATSGGYINRNVINSDPCTAGGGANPTFEFFPSKGTQQQSQFMCDTSGLNMYPHMFLMPSGKIFMQANTSTILWNYTSNVETPLPDMPNQIVRVYPASGATAMLPLTPANNYTPTILFCGGSAMSETLWGWYGGPGGNILDVEASKDCSSIQPELADGTQNPKVKYTSEEQMPDGRSMGQFIHLPTGQMVIVNGGRYGTAGYTNATYNNASGVLTEGLCQDPVYTPLLYDPEKPQGSRLSADGFGSSTIARLYHSTALLIPDGSVLIAGSNPHQDVALNMPLGTTPQGYNTTYAIEKWYPPYYFKTRPQPGNLPTAIAYGGNYFNITMDKDYMGDSANFKAASTKFMVIRPGFSTHAMNMGQRSLQLDYSYEVNSDGTVNYMVQPMPPNPNLYPPGPALFFVTIDGVPSKGVQIMVGSTAGQTFTVPFNPATSQLSVLPTAINSTNHAAVPVSDGSSSSSTDGLSTGAIAGAAAGAAAVIALIVLGLCFWRRASNRRAASKAGARNSAAPWTSHDVGTGYKRVHTPASSVHGMGMAGGANRGSMATFDSYRMNDMNSAGESKEALGQYFDNPRRQAAQPLSPSPLAQQSYANSPAQYGYDDSQGSMNYSQGWGEHHAGDAGQYYQEHPEGYGGYDQSSGHHAPDASAQSDGFGGFAQPYAGSSAGAGRYRDS